MAVSAIASAIAKPGKEYESKLYNCTQMTNEYVFTTKLFYEGIHLLNPRTPCSLMLAAVGRGGLEKQPK